MSSIFALLQTHPTLWTTSSSTGSGELSADHDEFDAWIRSGPLTSYQLKLLKRHKLRPIRFIRLGVVKDYGKSRGTSFSRTSSTHFSRPPPALLSTTAHSRTATRLVRARRPCLSTAWQTTTPEQRACAFCDMLGMPDCCDVTF